MKTYSEITGKTYESEDCVFFGNAQQSAAYCLWGATLIDVFPTNERRFVFVFLKEDHYRYKMKWNDTRPIKQNLILSAEKPQMGYTHERIIKKS